MDTNPNAPQNPGPPNGPQDPNLTRPMAPADRQQQAPQQQPQQPPAQQPQAPQGPGPQDGLTRPIESAARPSGAHARQEPGQQPPVPPVPPTQIPPGGPSGQGGPAKPAKQRSTGKLIGLAAAGLVAVLVIVLVGSELYIRNHVQNCLADNIKKGTSANDVKVSFEKTPMLIQNASGKIPSIDIQVDGMQGTAGLNAHLLLKGVEPSGDNKIDDATILGTFTADGIKNKVVSSQVISDPKVTLNTAANQIEISGTAVILPVTVNLKPTIKDNKVVLTASKASVFGIGVPDDLAQQLITAVADIPTPKGLTASDLKMTDEGISLRYSGQNVLPKDIESGSDVGATNCSVV
ncbi:LmeA family phospholipid-binding protein [Tsukamurella sp. DT100]|uniref:LmeA family phospholipid-binding protein n=1 Tax=Tsukamurella sp. DT100 TaxID=3393415 RepID=UPI003CF96534